MNRKINLFIRKYHNTLMWIAGICTLGAIIVSKITNFHYFYNGLYLTGFILAGLPIIFKAYQGLKFKVIGIELLVTLACIGALIIGEYSEAAIVTFLFQFGSFLEQKTMQKTRSAIKALTKLAPTTANRIVNDDIETIDVDEVEVDDILLVKTGDQIAVDGIVISGDGYVNEASITGEALPKHKTINDIVYAGTFLETGTLNMQATKVGEDTTFARIIALVEEAQDAKSPVERFIDRFAKYYTPAVVVLALFVLIITKNLDISITVLVLACPGALVIGAPIASVAGIGKAASNHILFKGGDAIAMFAKTSSFVFDKTGTLTNGFPKVTNIINYTDKSTNELLCTIASIEQNTNHPLALAIIQYAKKQQLKLFKVDNVETFKGLGVKAFVNNNCYLIGNKRLLDLNGVNYQDTLTAIENMKNDGSTTVLVSINNQLALIIDIEDEIKKDAKETINSLKKLGIKNLVMLTGDNENTAKYVNNELGLSGLHYELLPQNKLEIIKKMQEDQQIVTFVGDGINDSPALTLANTGIAMGSGTDVAIESSDVVLIKSDLESLVKAYKLAKKTTRIMYENIAIALATVALLLIGLFAGYVHMSIGMLIHEASILIVIFNALRLTV